MNPQQCIPVLAWAAVSVPGQPAPAQSPEEPLAVYAHSSSSTIVRARTWDGEAWGAELPAGSLSAGLTRLNLSRGRTIDADALLTVSEDRVVRLHRRDAGVWDAGTQLSGDVGSSQTPVAAVAHEGASGDLLIVYRSGASPTLRFRTHAGGVLSAESAVNAGLTGAPAEVLLVGRPGADPIALFARSAGTLTATIWDGSAFGSPTTLSTGAGTVGRACDAAYESASGDLLAVWSEGASIRYATRTGSWSGAAAAANLPGTVHGVRLIAHPGLSSNAALLCYESASGVVGASPWDGSSWGAAMTLDTQGAGATAPGADAAWQPDGSKAVVAWTRANGTLVRSRTWDGAAWSAERTGPTLAAPAQRVRLSPGRASGQAIALCLLRPATLSIDDYLVYAGSTLSQGTTVIHGPAASNAAGIDLPAPPAGTYGSTDLVYDNNETVTIAPGNYGDARFGNHCTIHLSAGTYRFKTFDISGNTIDLECDTSMGDIVFIVASGDLQPGNSFVVNNAGGGLCTFHVINGDFQADNGAAIVGADFRVYNGDIRIGRNLVAYGTFWAGSNVAIDSGDVFPFSASSGTSGPLIATPFDDGVAGAPTTLSSDARGGPAWESFDVAAPKLRPLRMTNWREVPPEP